MGIVQEKPVLVELGLHTGSYPLPSPVRLLLTYQPTSSLCREILLRLCPFVVYLVDECLKGKNDHTTTVLFLGQLKVLMEGEKHFRFYFLGGLK